MRGEMEKNHKHKEKLSNKEKNDYKRAKLVETTNWMKFD